MPSASSHEKRGSKKMKTIKILLCLILLVVMVDLVSGQVRDRRQRIYSVAVGSMDWVFGGGYLPWRVYYHVENQSTSHDVKRAAYLPPTTTDYGKLLRAPDGWWEDKYNVYMSSWWYIIDGGGPATISSYTAILVIHERD